MSEIHKFWKNRDGYTFFEAAYLALDMPPRPAEEKEHPLEVIRAVDDIKKTIKDYYPADFPVIESGERGISKLLVVVFAEHYGITNFFKDDPLRERALALFPSNKAPLTKNDDITESERQTMLKLIIGMAIDAYKYDPDAKRNPATGNNKCSIKAALERVGLSLTEKTISKYLEEAVERFPEAKLRKL
jgi:hypothetical protein